MNGTTSVNTVATNKKKHDYYGKMRPICNKEKLLPHCQERDKTGKKTGLGYHVRKAILGCY